MAQQTRVFLTDDLTGEELEGGQSISFGLEGTKYEIDLSKENADELRQTFKRYVQAARKVGGAGRPRAAATSSTGSRGSSDRERTQRIRAWAKDNGHTVNERGRIASTVVDAYEAAH